MKLAFNDDRFHRFIWLDPISKDPKIINPRRIAKFCEDVHATVLHYAATAPLTGRTYYPSKYRPLERTLKPGDDYLRDIVHECHKRNIKLVAYFNCHWMSEDNLPEGTNWIVAKADGQAAERAMVFQPVTIVANRAPPGHPDAAGQRPLAADDADVIRLAGGGNENRCEQK